MKRTCIICGARVRNMNPKVVTCGPDCTAKHRGKPAPELPEEGGPKCMHCGRATTEEEGNVCDDCYSQYTPGMLADLDQ